MPSFTVDVVQVGFHRLRADPLPEAQFGSCPLKRGRHLPVPVERLLELLLERGIVGEQTATPARGRPCR
jgi:hypothetical protein